MIKEEAPSRCHLQQGEGGRQLVLWLTGGLLLFAFGFMVSLTHGVNLGDEGWFLQVIYRLTTGDVLYRDVFFGVTPLSVYLTAVPVLIFGAEILVIKAGVTLCFVLTVLLSVQIARQLNPAPNRPFLLIAALLVYAFPYPHGIYQPLAQVFLLFCFSTALFWVNTGLTIDGVGKVKMRRTISLVIAGVAAGLCFAAKQNIGLYALAALLLTVLVGSSEPRRDRRELFTALLLVVVGFGLVSILVLVPIWFSGGIHRFIDYGFANKGTYLRTAGISYFSQLSQLFRFLQILSWDSFRQLHWYIQFLLPPLTLVALLITWWRASKAQRRLTAIVFFWVGVAFLGVFPRVDFSHFVYAVPQLLLGIAYAWYRAKPGLPKHWVHVIQVGLLLWLVFGLSNQIITRVTRIETGNFQISTLPHFRGALFPTDQYAEIQGYTEALVEATAGEQPLLLIPQAGFYYLTTGLKNPTPFDFPLVSAFGLNGEKEVIGAISQRRIRTVCLKPLVDSYWNSLRPALLEDYIQEYLKRGQDIELCTLYQSWP